MDVLMPQLGETVSEGKILVWYKSVGDAVAVGDNLFEIETEKVSMEVPATAAGVLSEIRVAVDETAPVGAVVAVISGSAQQPGDAEPAATVSASAPEAASVTKSAPAPAPMGAAAVTHPSRAPGTSGTLYPTRKLEPYREVFSPERNFGPARIGNGVVATPFARRLAAQAGIDLSGLHGSGPDARIVAKDIERLRGGKGQSRAPAERSMGGDSAAAAEKVRSLYETGSYVEVPLDNMRRVIARRLSESKQTVPHFYLTTDLDLDALVKFREALNAGGAPGKQSDLVPRISVNDLLIKAWAVALQRVPRANAVWAEDCLLQFSRSDVGVAIAVEGGLFTPVIREADRKSARDISREVKDLATRARERRLKAHELQGGASAISNLGMFGVREFSAIINPPQSTILAAGAIERRAVEAHDGGVRFASLMSVTLSCDHRVVDGVLGAELLAALREIVQQPDSALA